VLDSQIARAFAIESGFTEAGVVALPDGESLRDARRFEEWVNAGRAGTMRWLARRNEAGELVRARVATPFPWARSAVVCFASYDSYEPRSIDAANPETAWIARYAWTGKTDENGNRRASDYHKVLLKRLKALEARLRTELGEFEARAYVDTGPVVERSLAVAAGLGWTGKNTCLIHPRLGSFGFLAVLLTSLPVQKETAEQMVPAALPDRCGTCRRCIDACPTQALIAPYQMDASLCISYLTIEHKGPISDALAEGIGRQIFGCDICQDVCPWNGKARRSSPTQIDREMEARPELVNPQLDWLASMTESEFEAAFNGSPVRRAGFPGLRRNLAIAMANSGLEHFAEKLDDWIQDADEGVRAAARWGLRKLRAG
jgi:epoxyqueuosine reductase